MTFEDRKQLESGFKLADVGSMAVIGDHMILKGHETLKLSSLANVNCQ